jgi:hypothetical protein
MPPRRSYKKSTAGCKTCKSRRVKVGEKGDAVEIYHLFPAYTAVSRSVILPMAVLGAEWDPKDPTDPGKFYR